MRPRSEDTEAKGFHVRHLSDAEMDALPPGGGWTWCGIAVGLTIGATLMYGGVGFALTANKAFVSCVVPALG